MCQRGGAAHGVVMMWGVLLGMMQKFLLRICFDPWLLLLKATDEKRFQGESQFGRKENCALMAMSATGKRE